jgi:hypothetical protein
VAVKEEERRIVRYVKINVLLQLKLNLLYGWSRILCKHKLISFKFVLWITAQYKNWNLSGGYES